MLICMQFLGRPDDEDVWDNKPIDSLSPRLHKFPGMADSSARILRKGNQGKGTQTAGSSEAAHRISVEKAGLYHTCVLSAESD